MFCDAAIHKHEPMGLSKDVSLLFPPTPVGGCKMFPKPILLLLLPLTSNNYQLQPATPTTQHQHQITNTQLLLRVDIG